MDQFPLSELPAQVPDPGPRLRVVCRGGGSRPASAGRSISRSPRPPDGRVWIILPGARNRIPGTGSHCASVPWRFSRRRGRSVAAAHSYFPVCARSTWRARHCRSCSGNLGLQPCNTVPGRRSRTGWSRNPIIPYEVGEANMAHKRRHQVDAAVRCPELFKRRRWLLDDRAA